MRAMWWKWRLRGLGFCGIRLRISNATVFADPPGMKRSFRAKGERNGRGGRKGFATASVASVAFAFLSQAMMNHRMDDSVHKRRTAHGGAWAVLVSAGETKD